MLVTDAAVAADTNSKPANTQVIAKKPRSLMWLNILFSFVMEETLEHRFVFVTKKIVKKCNR
jgi:hypothetical protein